MIVGKQIADALTISRVFIALALAGLGFWLGPEALPVAVILMIFSWTGDSLDGEFARRSSRRYRTWVGDNDLFFDMLVSVGLLVYMMASGYFNLWLGVVYFIVWVMVFYRYGVPPSLGKLFQTPIYGWFIFIAITLATPYGVAILIWILLAIIITWPKFPEEVIPSFLGGFKETEDPDSVSEVNESRDSHSTS
jgi:phosphatidylglycerophosphate synthase